jgi:hypothetical protein
LAGRFIGTLPPKAETFSWSNGRRDQRRPGWTRRERRCHACHHGWEYGGLAGVQQPPEQQCERAHASFSIVAQNLGFEETGGDPLLARSASTAALRKQCGHSRGPPPSTRPAAARSLRLAPFCRVAPHLGAAEYQRGTDLSLYWIPDWHGDGHAFGIEHSLGTNPLASERNNARNLTPPLFNAEARQCSALAAILPAVMASPGCSNAALISGPGLEFTASKATRSSSILTCFPVTVGANSFTRVDKAPPQPKAFYQFRADRP